MPIPNPNQSTIQMNKLGRFLRLFKKKSDQEVALNKLKRKIGGQPRRVPGTAEIFGWIIEYVDNQAMLSSLEILVKNGYNDFQTANEKPMIIDCGANIGISILNYKRKHPTATILAFEPDPTILPVLRKNLRVNQIKDVTLVDAAVWVHVGESNFFQEGADGSRLVTQATNNSVKVKTTDLSQFLNQRIDLLKIDIEGAELAVIPHIKFKLALVQNLIVECHINGDQFGEFGILLKTLADSGFQINVNSFGKWRDLVRKPIRQPGEFDHYFLVCASRNK